MEGCVFCKIAKGEIPSHKVYEDEEFLAFLDIFPNTKGMTLVITKKHFPSNIFDLPEDVYKKMFVFVKKIEKTLDKTFNVKRCAMVVEGTGVNHTHIKLYPLHGLKGENLPLKGEVFFEEFPGYITTLAGPRADDKELEKVAKKIKESF